MNKAKGNLRNGEILGGAYWGLGLVGMASAGELFRALKPF